jgi:hypothetical protein
MRRLAISLLLVLSLNGCAILDVMRQPVAPGSDTTVGQQMGNDMRSAGQFLPFPFNWIAIGGGLLLGYSTVRKWNDES